MSLAKVYVATGGNFQPYEATLHTVEELVIEFARRYEGDEAAQLLKDYFGDQEISRQERATFLCKIAIGAVVLFMVGLFFVSGPGRALFN